MRHKNVRLAADRHYLLRRPMNAERSTGYAAFFVRLAADRALGNVPSFVGRLPADMLNITRQSFSLIEKEKQTPSILTSWLIAKVLNADMTELFYFEEIEEDKK